MALLVFYRLDTKNNTDDWEKMREFVSTNYGYGAICIEILEFDLSLDELAEELKKASAGDDPDHFLNTAILQTLNAGGAPTHVFVQPKQGPAVFGVSLRYLFE